MAARRGGRGDPARPPMHSLQRDHVLCPVFPHYEFKPRPDCREALVHVFLLLVFERTQHTPCGARALRRLARDPSN